MELNKKRNQQKESSCNTCGGRFLVDGIGSISANMLSTVRLEVSNSINPELNWKKVTKGRRSRKPTGRSLNWGGKLKNQSPKRVGDFSGFDSDKFCEIASEQRVPDKAEHIPIKKRRHLLRSKSPSKVHFGLQEESLSPQSLATPTRSEELELLSDHNHSSGHMSSDSYSSSQLAALKFCNGIRHNIMDLKFAEVANGSYYNSEDFSGIALLAAAACSNGMDDDSGTEKEGRDQVEKDNVTPESRDECPDSLETLSVIPHGVNDEQLREDKRSVSPKVDRLHWDLNTLMDSWGQPCDDQVTGNAQNDGDGSKKDKCEIDIGKEQMVPEVCQHDTENFMLSAEKDTKIAPSVLKTDGNMSGSVSCLNRTSVKEEIYDLNLRKDFESLEIKSIDKGISVHVDEKDTKVSPSVLRTDENLSGAVSCLNRTSVKEEIYGLNLRKDIESVEITSIDKGISAHVDDKNMSLGDHLANKSIHASTALVSEGASTVASVGAVAIQDSGYTQESIMGDPACDTGSKCVYNEDHIRTCQLPDDKILGRNVTDTVISKILDVVTSHSTCDEADNCHPSTKSEDLSVLKATVGDGQPIEGEVKWQEKIASASIAIGVDSQVQFVPKELSSRCSDGCGSNGVELTFLQGSSKIFKEGPQGDDLPSHSMKIGSFLEDCHRSNISHEGRGHTIVCEDMNGFQAGYDSPFEDGELRGSALCSWEENEADGEVECVDYDSDGNGLFSDAAHGSEVVEAGSEGSQGSEKRVSSASGVVEADFSKSSMSLKNLRVQSRRCEDKSDMAGKKGSDVGFGTMVHHSADTSVEGNDDLKKRHGFGFRWSYNEEFGLRTDRGKLQSRIEGPLYLDATDRKDSILLQHRRPLSLGCSYTRPERDFSPEKFVGRYRSAFHVRDRNAGDGHWGSWDSRSRYPSIHHGPEGHGNPRRRSFADLADRFGGMDSRDQRPSINYSSKDIQRPPGFRRRLSVDRDDCYDGPRRMLPARGGIINRNSRGGSGGYSQKNTRGFRQEGNLHLPDDDAPSVRMRHYLSRRDRSFSPSSAKPGRISLPRRKSRSRSRSSSPRAWHSQRDWNMSMRRQQGRSPELRTETRMERMRVPFKKSSYVAEYGEGFVSPTRRHFSPDRKSRWMEDQNFGVGSQLRRGRSPVRGIRRNQRFDGMGSDRLKSDDYFRPMIRTRRFPMMGNTGRVSKFENNYNDSRHDDRGEMMHQVRHSDVGSIGRRIGHDVDDKFEAAAGGNSQNNEDIQSSDVQGPGGSGGSREDKRTFIIQQQ